MQLTHLRRSQKWQEPFRIEHAEQSLDLFANGPFSMFLVDVDCAQPENRREARVAQQGLARVDVGSLQDSSIQDVWRVLVYVHSLN